MAYILLTLISVECIAFSNAKTTLSLDEIISYKEFLKNTVNGKPAASTRKLKELHNADELGGKFQGDIVLTFDQINVLVDQYAYGRNALINIARLWPNNTVVYNITIEHFKPHQIKAIEEAVLDIEKNSALKMLKWTNETAFISIEGAGEGCFSCVGYLGRKQPLNLQSSENKCFQHGVIVHELLHSIGFHHMHCTHNRDDWIEIIWKKVKDKYKRNFDKLSASIVTNLGETYDYGSVMHYSKYAFSIDGNQTIKILKNTTEKIGQRSGLSRMDIEKLKKLYGDGISTKLSNILIFFTFLPSSIILCKSIQS